MLMYLVRHGESEFNSQGRIQGQLDIGLSARGRRQSEAVAAALGTLPIAAVLTSPLQRAVETAAPVAAALGLAPGRDDRLKELDAGVFQGLTWDEVTARYPDEAERWRGEDPDFRIPQGESRRMLMARARSVADAIRGEGHASVVLVGHGGFFGAMLKSLLDVPAARNPFRFFNGSISRVEWRSAPRLVTLNETHHLQHLDGGLGRLGNL